jgi:ribosomal protein L11 methyltransferase
MYTQASFYTPNREKIEILMALLSDAGYEGFEETDERLSAFISTDDFDHDLVDTLAARYDVSVDISQIVEQNWNKSWESNFQPVIVEGFCTVRADFHKMEVKTPYEIIITPKMSFGTGHHATTQLMMEQMRDIDFKEKKVFDFGTGTGILAILAEMLGAAEVLAIDNDKWAYENSQENVGRNNCRNIVVKQGTIENVKGGKHFDIILANINRHILLDYMEQLSGLLADESCIALSGLLTDDKDIIIASAKQHGLKHRKTNTLNNWIMIFLTKQSH